MLTAKPNTEGPYIKGRITSTPILIGKIVKSTPTIKGSIRKDTPYIKAIVASDIKKEPYYEVSNEYGTTIVIGD